MFESVSFNILGYGADRIEHCHPGSVPPPLAREHVGQSVLRSPGDGCCSGKQPSQKGECTRGHYTNIQGWDLGITGQQQQVSTSGRRKQVCTALGGAGATTQGPAASQSTHTHICCCSISSWLACNFPISFALWPCFFYSQS